MSDSLTLKNLTVTDSVRGPGWSMSGLIEQIQPLLMLSADDTKSNINALQQEVVTANGSVSGIKADLLDVRSKVAALESVQQQISEIEHIEQSIIDIEAHTNVSHKRVTAV